ncbi:hypothetical protein [Hydrogenophaga pseudoflava]|uniref:hypothetical protein n=1 Tax=Hydrogenophaga pseudoflava TaxID=47421 RepID=UPI0027E4F777|nr:hypothetical protein [Hydrogenophaga pseudoflava]MDQ7746257.1 hypothetical protein [Hydrogenophaga pseudoflava]
MLKIIAILVFSGSLNVAVETDSGWAEKSFANTAKGAEELVGFAEEVVGDPPDGVRVVLGALNEDDNLEHIVTLFNALELKHSFATPEEVKAAAAKHQLSAQTAISVAKADQEKFGALYGRTPPK